MKIVYHTLVQKDLDDAWRYYESASEGLGGQFFDEFLAVIASIRAIRNTGRRQPKAVEWLSSIVSHTS